ncbi:MAG TPA: hypothetical protein VLD63_09420 [Anaerolineales bacterium]|nr:hypothetical protein [Anaerolineales bacterium]
MNAAQLLLRIRLILGFFLLALFLSGLTAIPLRAELALLDSLAGGRSAIHAAWPSLAEWISRVRAAVDATYSAYPFMAYGTDWLAFGHFVIALAFVGPIRDPVRNRWVVDLGILACLLLLPYAVVFGLVRGIPPFWTLVDSLFGFVGLIPLLAARFWIGQLSVISHQSSVKVHASGATKPLPDVWPRIAEDRQRTTDDFASPSQK